MENEKRFWISDSPMYREGDDFNTVYIVMQSTGQYEDSFESPLDVYDELEDAKKFINEQEDWKKHVNETAIGTDVDDSSDIYHKYENEFNQMKWHQLYPDKDMNDMTSEEEEEYFDSFDDEHRDFIDWLVKEKGLPEDVAECTVTYHTSLYDDQAALNASYYIIRANRIKKGEVC